MEIIDDKIIQKIYTLTVTRFPLLEWFNSSTPEHLSYSCYINNKLFTIFDTRCHDAEQNEKYKNKNPNVTCKYMDNVFLCKYEGGTGIVYGLIDYLRDILVKTCDSKTYHDKEFLDVIEILKNDLDIHEYYNNNNINFVKLKQNIDSALNC